MSSASPQIYFEKTLELSSPYRLGDDPRPLQLAFAQLFDEAARVIYLAGSDLDEVLAERCFVVRHADKIMEFPADVLADAERLKQSILQHVMQDSIEVEWTIVAVRIVARHDQLYVK